MNQELSNFLDWLPATPSTPGLVVPRQSPEELAQKRFEALFKKNERAVEPKRRRIYTHKLPGMRHDWSPPPGTLGYFERNKSLPTLGVGSSAGATRTVVPVRLTKSSSGSGGRSMFDPTRTSDFLCARKHGGLLAYYASVETPKLKALTHHGETHLSGSEAAAST